MNITRKELLSKQYEIIDIVLEFDTVNDGEANSFLMHVFDKANKVYMTYQFNIYSTFYYVMNSIPIEEEEKVELIKEVAQFQDEWESTLKGEDLPEVELLTPDKVVEQWEEFLNLGEDEDYEEAYEFDGDGEVFNCTFGNGLHMEIEKGVDEYTVTIESDPPKMASFSNFENMLYGIAPTVQENVEDEYEFMTFAQNLYLNYAEDAEVERLKDEIRDILMK